jgi:uncharacterized protein
MTVRMELSRILIRELNDYQIIELREVGPITEDGEGTANGGPQGTPSGTASAGAANFSQLENGRSFPIVIGLPEAQAIERRLKGIQIKRPQTHDLLTNVIEALGGKLESITINDLSDQTFYALLTIRDKNGKTINVDSRPSDAIALGIAGNVPIFVAEHVLDSVQRDEP